MTKIRNGSLRRSADPSGYWIGDSFHAGFADDSSLPEGYRRRIATWARTADTLSEAQRALLRQSPTREISAAQKRAEALAGIEGSPMWGYLTEEEQGMVRDPATHPTLAGVSYPLGIGQLAMLTGSTQDQIRHWHELGLLRARRSKGGHRQFFADATTRAFFFRKNMSQSYITVLRDLNHLRVGPLFAGMATLMHEQASASASAFDADDHALLTQTARDLGRLSVVFAARSGVKTPS
jgi:hypothetical protein